MQDHNSTCNISALHERSLSVVYEFVSHPHQPQSRFSDELIQAIKQAYRTKLLNPSSITDFRKKGDNPIVYPTNVNRPLVKIRKELHNVIFDNIPTGLFRDLIWPSRFIFFSIWNNVSLTSCSEKGLHKSSLSKLVTFFNSSHND